MMFQGSGHVPEGQHADRLQSAGATDPGGHHSDEVVYQQLFPRERPYHARVIGSHADIQAAGLVDVRAFFKQYYVPNNASLAIVGDIDVDATRKLVEKYFGTIFRGAEVPAPEVTVPTLTDEKRLTVTDQVQLPRVSMSWVTPPNLRAG